MAEPVTICRGSSPLAPMVQIEERSLAMNAIRVPSGEGMPFLASTRNWRGSAPVIEMAQILGWLVVGENPLASKRVALENQVSASTTKSLGLRSASASPV